jgi:DNA-binding MarR family transcriptional regulator
MIDLNAKIEALEQTTLPRIMIYLYREKKASRTDLRNGIKGSQAAIYKALPLLKENGLIEEGKPSGFSRRIDIWLTEKGKKVAEKLIELEKILTAK